MLTPQDQAGPTKKSDPVNFDQSAMDEQPVHSTAAGRKQGGHGQTLTAGPMHESVLVWESESE